MVIWLVILRKKFDRRNVLSEGGQGNVRYSFPSVNELWLLGGCLLLLVGLSGCWRASPHEVVVYTAHDREFSQPIFEDFTAKTGIVVRAKYDTEATKTVGLANALLAEASRPRCDVFWNNESLNTIRLRKQQVFQPYHSPQAEAFPDAYRNRDGYWTGFAARARVFLVNTEHVARVDEPAGIEEMTDARWRGKVGFAKPLFGTTASHATVLFHCWGTEEATAFFEALRDNGVMQAGNKQVAQAVARGRLAWGLTDTDDAMVEIRKGMPVRIVYPDQGSDQAPGRGTLFLPNTVSLIRGAPHPEAGKALIDYLLSAEVEQKLAAGPSAQIPLRKDVHTPSSLPGATQLRKWDVDLEAAAACWDVASRTLEACFLRPSDG